MPDVYVVTLTKGEHVRTVELQAESNQEAKALVAELTTDGYEIESAKKLRGVEK